jgi:integrase/recombinase XerD
VRWIIAFTNTKAAAMEDGCTYGGEPRSGQHSPIPTVSPGLQACAADIADLGEDTGHRVLRVVRKGARKAKIPLTPATVVALDSYLADRVRRAGVGEWRQLTGPLLATAADGRLRQGHLWELVRRLARAAGVSAWEQLSPHSLRHSAITFALDAGASLRDVQDYAGHKDPRTTRRYDHSRDSLDRNAAYTVAAYLA